ncbi:MAG: hypothetical protein QOG67_3426 [Verrucomicrobiota bacterium]|jgi:hypothetical protein
MVGKTGKRPGSVCRSAVEFQCLGRANALDPTAVPRFGAEIKALTASLKEQAAQIQKVSAQLELTRPIPQVVVNKPVE